LPCDVYMTQRFIIALVCSAVLLGPPVGAAAGADGAMADSAYTDLVVLPIVFYTPETGVAFGAAGAYFFRPHPESRTSSLSGIGFYSQRGNLLLGITPELYSRDGSHRMLLGVSYQDFPQSFWGIGGDTTGEMEEEYTSRAVMFNCLFQHRFLRGARAGLRYKFRYERLTDVEEGGMLSEGILPGADEHIVSGLGVVATWDKRDNIFFSKKGAFVEALAVYHGDLLGSDYAYGEVSLDARLYAPLYGDHSLALRGLTASASGDVPFQELPRLGGAFLLRGYDEGRFRDKVLVAFQAEYRSAYWGRVGIAVFGSYADVAGRWGDLDPRSFKYAAGMGVRFRLNEENFNLRIDAAVGEDSDGFYFVAGEAF